MILRHLKFYLKYIALFVLSIPLSFYAWLSIRKTDFKTILSKYTNSPDQTSSELPISQYRYLMRATEMIDAVSNLVPWRVKCYESALTLLIYAKLFKIPLTITFGINNDQKVSAHAWTSSGSKIFTGKDEMPAYTPLYFQSYIPSQR